MANRVTKNITISDAKVIFKNFSGAEAKDPNNRIVNRKGDRNFGVLLTDELAEALAKDGWNVKFLRPREDDPTEYRQPWLPVKVKFEPYPPVVTLINSRGKKQLDDVTVGQLDGTLFEYCDLIIRPYNYPEFNGRPAGVSAYLKAIYVTKMEDELELKYAELEELAD